MPKDPATISNNPPIDRARLLLSELSGILGLGESSHGLRPCDIARDVRTNRVVAARAWLKLRRVRDSILGGDLFSDPAWDMLLDLYVQAAIGRAPSVSDLCLASHVPATTALRWISRLEEQALVTRSPDPRDGRRVYVQLTAKAIEQLDRTMDSFLANRADLGSAN